MSRPPRTVELPSKVVAASMDANSLSASTTRIHGATSKVTTKTTILAAKLTGVTTVVVSGIDLTQYMQSPSEDTPFERFLKDENRLERLASLPCSCRPHKL